MAVAEVVPIRGHQQFTVTLFANRFALSASEQTLTARELVELILATRTGEKDKLPLLKLALFGDQRTSEGSLRSDANLKQITGIECDYDKGQMDPQEAVEVLREHGVFAIVHSSPRHKFQHPKWRILCPTSRPLEKGERARLVARINGILGGALDKASFTPSQSFYYGSCEETDVMYAEVVEGRPVDLLTELDAKAIWPEKTVQKDQPYTKTTPSSLGLDLYERRKLTREQLAKILEAMPNAPSVDTPWKDHDVWKDIGFCISSMTDHAAWAGEMFVAWSSQWGGEKPDRPQQLWDSIEPGTERYGFTRLSELFDAYHREPGKIRRVMGEQERPFDGEAQAPAGDAPLHIVSPWARDPVAIPKRDWLVPRLLLRKHLSILAAPGATAKSTFTLQVAMAMATGIEWGGFRPVARLKTLVLNVEDDVEELERRVAAAARVMNVDRAHLVDWLDTVNDLEDICIASTLKGNVIVKPFWGRLMEVVANGGYDAVIVDPFTETFEGEESSNSEAKWAATLWRRLARECQCAVWLVHHTPKANKDMQGDVAAVRGAGAIANVTRVASTMFAMTEAEAEAAGVEPAERHRYVRFDDAKSNLTLMEGRAHWFQKVGVEIGNGDEVGALKPWAVPGMFGALSQDDITQCLAALDRTPDPGKGLRYSTTRQSGDWAGHVLVRTLKVSEARAIAILDQWLKSGRLFLVEYRDRNRKPRMNGIGVNWEGLDRAHIDV